MIVYALFSWCDATFQYCLDYVWRSCYSFLLFFFFQAEDGIRDLVRSRGLGDVYKRQGGTNAGEVASRIAVETFRKEFEGLTNPENDDNSRCLLYTSDAADERSSVDLGGSRIIKKKTRKKKKKNQRVDSKKEE